MNGYACSDHNVSPSYHLDVFKAMFSKAESKEEGADEASLTIDCKPDILSSFLHFLYNDQLEEEKGSHALNQRQQSPAFILYGIQ